MPSRAVGQEDRLPVQFEDGGGGGGGGGGVKARPSVSRKAVIALVVLVVLVVVALALIVASAVSAADETASDASSDNADSQPSAEALRLPTHLRPVAYDWRVKTFLPYERVAYEAGKNFTVEGEVAITFECVRQTDVLTLNQIRLNFSSDSFAVWEAADPDAHRFGLKEIRLDEPVQMVQFHLDSTLQPGHTYIARILYTAPISADVLSGIYRGQYTQDGVTKWTAATQMEPTDARRALPCFDEPSLKATFNVTIVHPHGTRALSNGIELHFSQPIGDGWLETKFDTTPKMSTYLLAIAVGDFVYSERFSDSGVRFRIWSRPDMVNLTSYALDIGPICLDYYEKYFDIPFPMKKQDMIALPDFAAGAMENWGLITYREKYLLYDPSIYALPDKQRVAVVIAHELAHQWFGNLVTMKWWDDLWLNEGFATFMEYVGTEFITDGAFDMGDDFIVTSVQSAMGRDQLATSHPLYVPIARSQDMYEVFDAISYDKGGAVLQMLNNLVGPAIFKHGLKIYLNRFKYQNAGHNDLWQSFTEAVASNGTIRDWRNEPLNITEFFASWTLQMGFPYINVSQLSNGSVIVSQKRFKLDEQTKEKDVYKNPPFGYTWHVPLWHKSSTSGRESLKWLLTTEEPTVLVDSLGDDDDWLLLNTEAKGYYRVLYSSDLWRRLADQLLADHTTIPLRSRSQLLDDAFEAARAGLVDYETPLALTAYLSAEDGLTPWRTALRQLGTFETLLQLTPRLGSFRRYVLRQLAPVYERRGWPVARADDEHVSARRLQTAIVSWTCAMGHEGCVERAVQLYTHMLANCTARPFSHACNTIPPSVRKSVYCAAIRYGPTDRWQHLWTAHLEEQNQVEFERQVYGLACSREPWLIKRLLNETIVGQHVRQQDIVYYFYYTSYHPVGAIVLWEFFKENWPTFIKQYSESKYTMRRIIYASTGFISSDHYVDQLEAFIKANSAETSKFGTFDEQVEKAKANADWMRRNYERLTTWFEEHSKVDDK